MVKLSFPGSLYFENTRKNFKSNLVLVVVLVLESKGLHYQKLDQRSNSPTYILQCTNLGIYGFSPHEFNEN